MEKNKRQVPRLRFPGFNDAWEQRKLGECVKFKITNSFSRENLNYENGKVRNIHYGDIHTKFQALFDIAKEKVPFINSAMNIDKISEDFYCKEGDLVFADASEDLKDVGKSIEIINLNNEKVLSGLHTLLARPSEKKFSKGFNGYLFQSSNVRLQIQKQAQGSKVLSINTGRLSSVVLSFPALEEQTTIGNFFRQLDAAIASHQRKLERVKELKKSLLQKMFPKDGEAFPELRFPNFTDAWEQRKLGKLVNIVGGGTPDTTNPEYWNGDIDWYSPTEIGTKVYANGSVKKITALGLEKSSAKILPANSTILFTSRAGIGDMAILKKQGATNQGFQSFVVGNGVNVYFLYSMGRQIKDFAIKNASGSTFLEISKNQLAKMNVIIPNEKEQTAIGNFFKQLDAAIASHQRKLEHMQTLKKGLLQQMFV